MKVNILFIGDVVGRGGRQIIVDKLAGLVSRYEADCVIANAENAAGGSGLTPTIYQKLVDCGINLITLGDHTYRKREIIEILEMRDNIVRPANFSEFAAGKDIAVYKTAKGPVVGVTALIGRVFMKPADCPYAKADKLLAKLNQKADIAVVDFHAEATSEKIAMGYYLDGRVGAVLGTHTHVATADEQVLAKGTAYITDAGMTGPHDSILGRKKENVLKSFRTQMPYSFDVATGDVRLNGVVVTIDSNSKKAERIERISIGQEYGDSPNYDSDDGRPEYYNGF